MLVIRGALIEIARDPRWGDERTLPRSWAAKA